MPKVNSVAVSTLCVLMVAGCATNTPNEEDVYLTGDDEGAMLEPPVVMDARISHIVTFDFDSICDT